MKAITQFINEAKYFKLNDDERSALADFIGVICGNLGEDDDRKEFKVVIDELSDNEMKQLDDIYDFLSDTYTYKVVNSRNLGDDDIYRIKKIYHLMDNNNLLTDQWDLIDAFEKILGLN